MTSPCVTRAALVSCLFFTALTTASGQVGAPVPELPMPETSPRVAHPPAARQEIGCGVQYRERAPLNQVEDPRVQAVFKSLLMQFQLNEPVLLCGDIPPEQKYFAETVRRSDRRAVVAISKSVLSFGDKEIAGILAHELAHLMAADPDRPRPVTFEQYLGEERAADLAAAAVVGREAVYAAVMRVYWTSVAAGDSDLNGLRRYRDLRLAWLDTDKRLRRANPALRRAPYR